MYSQLGRHVCIQENESTKITFCILNQKQSTFAIGNIFQYIPNVPIYKDRYMETKDMLDNKLLGSSPKKTDAIELLILRVFSLTKGDWLLPMVGNAPVGGRKCYQQVTHDNQAVLNCITES